MDATAGARSAAGELRRRLRVARGLAEIELPERISARVGRRLSAPARRRAIARAKRRVPPLERWEQIPERTFARYSSGGSAVRIERLLDLVPPGSRILDIGIGSGYITGVLLRDLHPAHYCGVDLRESFTEATRGMIAANDLGDRPVELVVSDVFELDRDFWRDHDFDVVLLLEMLEHLKDPTGALRAIATAVDPGTAILFTVPLSGRLEWVWGHRSIFDRRRLQRICTDAGLRIERAEPVQSTWSLLVTTATGAGTAPAHAREAGYTFKRVSVRKPAATYRRPTDGPDVELDSSSSQLRCVVRAADGHAGGGVRLRMPNPRLVRLDLSLDPPAGARRLRVSGVDKSGRERLAWVGDGADPAVGRRTTYVLRPGKTEGALASEGAGNPEGVTWIEVSVEAQPGAGVALTVHRAGYVGGGPAPDAATSGNRGPLPE
jgi:2-polyprenyl-3-methyl-5-hydroxy-6-metoxy-1,4-benzoquinol methylase